MVSGIKQIKIEWFVGMQLVGHAGVAKVLKTIVHSH